MKSVGSVLERVLINIWDGVSTLVLESVLRNVLEESETVFVRILWTVSGEVLGRVLGTAWRQSWKAS